MEPNHDTPAVEVRKEIDAHSEAIEDLRDRLRIINQNVGNLASFRSEAKGLSLPSVQVMAVPMPPVSIPEIREFLYGNNQRVIYVDSSFGNDNNSGKRGTPVQTVQKGIDIASASGIVLVFGNHNISAPLFLNAGRLALVAAQTSFGLNYNGPTSLFSSGLGSDEAVVDIIGDNIILDGFTIRQNDSGPGLRCTNGQQFLARRLSVQGGGIQIKGMQGARFERCQVSMFTGDPAIEFYIQSGNTLVDVTIEDCELYSTSGGGVVGTDVDTNAKINSLQIHCTRFAKTSGGFIDLSDIVANTYSSLITDCRFAGVVDTDTLKPFDGGELHVVACYDDNGLVVL